MRGYDVSTFISPYEKNSNISLKQTELTLRGRLRIAEEGINGTVEGLKSDIVAYKRFLDSSEHFDNIDFKTSRNRTPRAAFASLKVTYTKELVTLGKPLSEISQERGTHLKPAEFH